MANYRRYYIFQGKRPSGDSSEANASKRLRPDEVAAANIAARIQALNAQVASNTHQSTTRNDVSQGTSGEAAEREAEKEAEFEAMKKDVAGIKETMTNMSVNMTNFMKNITEALNGDGPADDENPVGSAEEDDEGRERTENTGQAGMLAAVQAYQTLTQVATNQSHSKGSPIRAFPPPPKATPAGSSGECTQLPRVYHDDLGPNMRVSEAIRKKILAGEFVEMADVLEWKAQATPEVPEWFQLIPALQTAIQGNSGNKKTIPLAEWVTAFNKFMYVYTGAEVHKDEARDMLAYMNEVIRIAKEGKNWDDYDRKFRTDRAEQPVGQKMRWSHFHSMHYQHLAMLDHKGQGKSEKGGVAQVPFHVPPRYAGRAYPENPSIPLGFCFNYHQREERCKEPRTCKFKHQCPIEDCRETHPVYLHTFHKLRKNARRGSTAAKPPRAANSTASSSSNAH